MNIKNIKKIELHLHLDGSLRPESVIDIAKKDGIELPTFELEGIRKYLTVDDGNKDLVEYLKKFDWFTSLSFHTAYLSIQKG